MVFGIGTQSQVVKLTVTWPDGTIQEFTDVPLDKYHTLKRGEKNLLPVSPIK